MGAATEKMKAAGLQTTRKHKDPLWKGPGVEGITQSMLCRFLACRERFRCWAVLGLGPREDFNAKLEFGNLWHACEEALAGRRDWLEELRKVAKAMSARFRTQQDKVQHWYDVTKAMFPVYVDHWKLHPDVEDREPVVQERTFKIPYDLPSGRTVYLRGKYDAVDVIQKLLWLQEDKTKSGIDRQKITRQLKFDIQTMMYATTLTMPAGIENLERASKMKLRGLKLGGVRYNVIRRGQHKTVDSLMKKLGEDYEDKRDREWFDRWKVEVYPVDIERFRREFLDPILEQLCSWYEWISSEAGQADPFANPIHWRHPFGVYNPMDTGGFSDLDRFLEDGNEVGLVRVESLFPELEGRHA